MQVNNSSERLADLCSELVRRLRLLERTEVACCGVPLSQAMVLQTLHDAGSAERMSAVAAALGVAQSTATRLVDPLVREGLVRREPDPEDGRVVVIRLTDRGRCTAQELETRSQRWSMNILQRIPETEHKQVLTALETVVGAVNECCAGGCGVERAGEVVAAIGSAVDTRRAK